MHDKTKYNIHGLVINQNGHGVPNLKVEAWDKDLLIDDFLGSAITNNQGEFSITFDSSKFREFFLDKSPDVFFKVYHNGDLIRDTSGELICNAGNNIDIEIKIEWDLKDVKETKDYRNVSGEILLESGLPAVGVDVKVYNKTLRLDELRAETITDNQGRYQLDYLASGVRNILVRVFNVDSQEPIAISHIVLNASEKEKVDLSIEKEGYQGLSLYETIERDVAPHINKTAISKLNPEELALLSSESGLSKEHLGFYQQAHQRVDKNLSPEVLFALAYNNVGISEKELVNLSGEKIKHYVAKSWEEHVIPKQIASTLEEQLAAHEKQNIKHQLTHSSFASKIALKDIWSIANPTEAQFEILAVNLKDSKNTPAEFWETLKNDDATRSLAPKLELLTQLNNLTFGNLSLIQKLSYNKSIASLEDLAGRTIEEWQEFIDGQTIPEEIKGEPEERIKSYALGMKRMVDYLYPTKNIFVSLAADENIPATLKSDYAVFYKNNPDFDYARTDLDQLLASEPNTLAGVKNKKEFKNDLERNIRLYRLIPEVDQYQYLAMLRDMKMNSANDIVNIGMSGFSKEVERLGGDKSSAEIIVSLSQRMLALISTVFMKYQVDTQVVFYVLNSGIRQTPEWKAFFGSEDYCECQHCKSVYSPAAYLTDCLHFLEKRKLQDGTSVYDELNKRRPDIKHIRLNCENANTPMPYIDLVNEVLETAVIKESDSTSSRLSNSYQTTGTTEELLANPEHQKMKAYDSLKESAYPWSMPFDFSNELGKTYLKHLGVAHHKLMSLFPFRENIGGIINHGVGGSRKTKAILGLNKTDWELQSLLRYDHDQEIKLWGINENEVIENTSNVEFFLKKSQLTLDELRGLVLSRFVNPNNELELYFPNPCSLVNAEIKNLTRQHRKRMIQVIRLQRKLNVDIRTIDHILTALHASSTNSGILEQVAQLLLWHQEYNIPYAELITWIGVLPTAYPSDSKNHKELYEKLFLSVLEEQKEQEEEETTVHFQLARDKTALKPNSISLIELPVPDEDVNVNDNEKSKSVRNYILGALRITADQLAVAIKLLDEKKLTLVNLSKIYGYFSLSRFLKIEIDELFLLDKIIESPSTVKTRNILELMDFVDQIRLAGLSVQQTLFLFDKTEEGKLPLNRKTEILQEIREGLWKFNNQWADKALEDAPIENESVLAAPLTAESFIFEKLSMAFAIDRNNIIRLLEAPKNDSSESYLSYFDDISHSQKSYIDSFFDDTFAIPESTEPVEPEADQPILDKFPNINYLFDLLHKISLLFNALDCQDQHYESLITIHGKIIIDLNKIDGRYVTDDTLTGIQLFRNIVKLLKINEVIKGTTSTTSNLIDLVLPGHRGNLIELFDYDDIEKLRTILGFTEFGDYSNPDMYLNLLSAIAMEQHLGIHIADYLSDDLSGNQFLWAKSDLEYQQVMEIVQVAKSKYGEEKWQTVTQQLRNVIREKQRDALLAYITANDDKLNTPEKLYAHYLIDTEMNSRTITSRIKLALSSVQLFVQRCLMNLEQNISLQGIGEVERLEWEEWSWRKNYRVWEANRKVFLYPENWLEPEWRDNKTQFFKELETQLQQNELNDVNAEKAYLSYLGKLESVNNLEIMAMCEAEIVDGILSGYYIFGRTHGSPKTLYFRKYELNTESFTAWEKIDIDFEGDHLLPAIHKGRLHLFWPVFGEKSVQGTKANDVYPEPTKSVTMQLAWAQFYNHEWAPIKLTEQSFELNRSTLYPHKNFEKSNIYITYNSEAEEISVFIGFAFNEYNGWYAYRTVLLDFSGNSPVVQIAQENGEYFFYPRQLRINYDFLLRIENQKSMTERHFSDAAQIYLHNRPLIRNIKQQVSFITFPYEKPWNSNSSLIIQTRDISVLLGNWDNRTFNFLAIPLQATLYATLVNEIGTYGLRSSYVYSNWVKVYQSESFKISELELDAESGVLKNPDAIDRNINLHSSPAFSQYTWELFFHIPMHIANKLRQDQKFEEAQQWFHYVFNPTSSDSGKTPERFWLFQPFRDYLGSDEEGVPKNIQELMRILNKEAENDGDGTFEINVQKWERNPFSPHTVARGRIVAYMKWVVMRYIDNLIEWADQLFRRDSIESLNEATQLYMLAWNILGGEPRPINEQEREDRSYEQIRGGLDQFSNFSKLHNVLMKMENKLFIMGNDILSRHRTNIDLKTPVTEYFSNKDIIVDGSNDDRPFDINERVPYRVLNKGQYIINPRNLYFCIPQNEKLLGYWDLVRDRFFKLRNSLNIEGAYRQLPLYEPPIDPALLIKARAAGLSIADALSAQYQPRSHYRFLALLQKAVDYANDVRGFGGALLSAMEKRDAERISVLRSLHEVQLLDEATFIRKEQINELKESNEALEYSRKGIENRRAYYAEKEFMNQGEKEQQSLQGRSNKLQQKSQSMTLFASYARQYPTYEVGYSGAGGHFTNKFGGETVGSYMEMAAKAFSINASSLGMKAAKVGQMASYVRRSEDWKFQESAAEIELKQIEKQILASEIRMAIAQQELRNHSLQVENSKKQLELVQTKFTNAELYEWMVGQLKTLYFQSYQMAFDMAKKAKYALDYELGIGGKETESFIKFGYWDKLKEGLLSGEKLHHDLKRMEAIYMQRNKRRQEVTQTFSLAMVNPLGLLNLRRDGSCNFKIDKILFDLANDRLKNRKVKSVSLTIPAVTGPYTGIHATLSNGSERITTSSGQNDSGLFQFSFNNERYLPFEGINPCGSSWELEMNSEFRAFDYNTISDVLLHINYTADYGEPGAIDIPEEGIPVGRYFSLKHEFSDDWFKAKENIEEPLRITIDETMSPFAYQSRTKSIVRIQRSDIFLDRQTDSVDIEVIFEEKNDGEFSGIVDLGEIEDINELEDIILVVTYKVS